MQIKPSFNLKDILEGVHQPPNAHRSRQRVFGNANRILDIIHIHCWVSLCHCSHHKHHWLCCAQSLDEFASINQPSLGRQRNIGTVSGKVLLDWALYHFQQRLTALFCTDGQSLEQLREQGCKAFIGPGNTSGGMYLNDLVGCSGNVDLQFAGLVEWTVEQCEQALVRDIRTIVSRVLLESITDVGSMVVAIEQDVLMFTHGCHFQRRLFQDDDNLSFVLDVLVDQVNLFHFIIFNNAPIVLQLRLKSTQIGNLSAITGQRYNSHFSRILISLYHIHFLRKNDRKTNLNVPAEPNRCLATASDLLCSVPSFCCLPIQSSFNLPIISPTLASCHTSKLLSQPPSQKLVPLKANLLQLLQFAVKQHFGYSHCDRFGTSWLFPAFALKTINIANLSNGVHEEPPGKDRGSNDETKDGARQDMIRDAEVKNQGSAASSQQRNHAHHHQKNIKTKKESPCDPHQQNVSKFIIINREEARLQSALNMQNRPFPTTDHERKAQTSSVGVIRTCNCPAENISIIDKIKHDTRSSPTCKKTWENHKKASRQPKQTILCN